MEIQSRQPTCTPGVRLGGITGARSNAVFSTATCAADGFDRLSKTTLPDSSAQILPCDANGDVPTGQTQASATFT